MYKQIFERFQASWPTNKLPGFIFLAIFGVALLCIMPGAVRLLQINLVSVNYLHRIIVYPLRAENIPYAPVEHPRGILWNALTEIRTEHFALAIELLQPMAQNGNRNAWYLMALAYEKQQNYSQAITIQQSLGNTNALLQICRTARKEERYDDAQAACLAAYDIDFVAGAYPLADTLIEGGDFYTAEVILRDALTRAKSSSYRPYWFFALATTLMRQERWAEAIDVYQQGYHEQETQGIVVKNPPYYYADLAWAYCQNGQIERAIETTQTSIQALDKFDADPFYVWFRAAQIYERAGKLNEALTAYQTSLEHRPYHTTAQNAVKRLMEILQPTPTYKP